METGPTDPNTTQGLMDLGIIHLQSRGTLP